MRTLDGPKKWLITSLYERLTAAQKLYISKMRHGELPWQDRMGRTIARLFGGAAKPVPVVVARGYDARRCAMQNLLVVEDLFKCGGVSFTRLPSQGMLRPALVISRSDLNSARCQLASLLPERGWKVEEHYGETLPPELLKQTNGLGARKGLVSFVVGRVIASPEGRVLSTPSESVTVQVWSFLNEGASRADGGTHIAGTIHRAPSHYNAAVNYLTPGEWDRALTHHSVEIGGPLMMEITEPVDLVYTWVDGSDPRWRRRKFAALQSIDAECVNETAIAGSRFKNRDELKYSLRSVEMYASWVQHIYIVTDGQVPSWLDLSHPKITIVDHTEIFANEGVLPVFNSHAIESQLHRISGLAEQYIYMNDDVFFGRPTDPDLFFTSSGLSKFFLSSANIDLDAPSPRDMPVLSAAKQNRDLLARTFGRVATNKFKHTPHPQIRSILEELELEYTDEFTAVSASKVRHPGDKSIASALYHYYAYLTKRAVMGNIAYDYVDIASPGAELLLTRLARRTDLDVFCINDTNTAERDLETANAVMFSFLEQRYPCASSFEIP